VDQVLYLIDNIRYHEANKTYIRGVNKLCKKIIGYDANALCLWAIGQEMPTGKHEHIKTYDLKYSKMLRLNLKILVNICRIPILKIIFQLVRVIS
jgi:hypothetical protein